MALKTLALSAIFLLSSATAILGANLTAAANATDVAGPTSSVSATIRAPVAITKLKTTTTLPKSTVKPLAATTDMGRTTTVKTTPSNISSGAPNIQTDSPVVSTCKIMPTYAKEVRKNLSVILERKPQMLQYRLHLANGSLEDESRHYYKPWYWIRTKGRRGQALLMLPFYYSEMSFGMLSIGELSMTVEIKAEPQGCLESLDIGERVMIIRELLLNDFEDTPRREGKLGEQEYLCGLRIHDVGGYGSFIHECCRHGPDKSVICLDLERDFWISILTILLTAIKVIIFLFCPLMLPGAFYSARYILEKYKLVIPKPIEFNVYVTENKKKKPPVGVMKLTRKHLAPWKMFLSLVEDKKLVPRDTLVTMHVNEINLRMQKKRVISRTYVPVGLITFLYDNFIRCRVRRNPPLTACCNANLCGKWAPMMCSPFTWINFFLLTTKVFLLLALPFPYYIRLYMYYMYEAEEMETRHESLAIRHLRSEFEGNFVAYLSPIHILFLVIYVIFVIEGICIRLLGNDIRNRFKFVLRHSLREMRDVPYSEKIQLGARILLYPLHNFGCFGFIIGAFYWLIAIPIVIVGGIFYFVPMVYLTIRVFVNFYSIVKELRHRRSIKDPQNPGVNDKISENHMGDFLPGVTSSQASADDQVARLRRRYLLKEILMQIFTMLCTVATIYATTIILVECCGFFVELAAFTMMGVIVNARITMKYVSLVFLLAIYLYDSYNSVHLTYKDLANNIIDNAKSRAKNVDEEASKAESMQENTAFIIHAPEDDEDPPQPPTLTMDNKVPRWQINRPLLFLDTQDFLYVSQKFFEEFCCTCEAGCPGPVYISLLKATMRFLTMVAFLGFVLIVVMVFSDAYNVSTNNQMLATLAGGMLPFLLRNIVFSQKQTLTLSLFSFKYLYDHIVRNYQKRWEIFDLDVNLGPVSAKEPEEVSDETDGRNTPVDAVVDLNGPSEDFALSPALITMAGGEPVSPVRLAGKGEDVTLIDSGYAFGEDDDPRIDLFIDMSINEKQVQIVRKKDDQIV